MRVHVGIFIALALVSASCDDGASSEPKTDPDHTMVFVSPSGDRSTLDVEVADDDEERAYGLMGVTSLPERSGMAFVFDQPSSGSFWMKDTLIPLSIAFVDSDGTIVGIREMTPCDTDPCPTYGVDEDYMLAVEANRGFFSTEGIEVGDAARLEEFGHD